MSKATAVERLENMISFSAARAMAEDRDSHYREMHLRAGLSYGHALQIVKEEIPDDPE
jgi:hypothetical protein